MIGNLVVKQPRLVNLSNPLLFQDYARPHTLRQTVAKSEELRLECVGHPLYCCKRLLLCSEFGKFLARKKFNSNEPVQTTYKGLLIIVSTTYSAIESMNYL